MDSSLLQNLEIKLSLLQHHRFLRAQFQWLQRFFGINCCELQWVIKIKVCKSKLIRYYYISAWIIRDYFEIFWGETIRCGKVEQNLKGIEILVHL